MDGETPGRRRGRPRAQPQDDEASSQAMASSSSSVAQPATDRAQATRRQSARASQSNRVSYAPVAYPELDDDYDDEEEQAQPQQQEHPQEQRRGRRSAAQAAHVHDEEADEQADNEDEGASPAGMRPQRARRSVRGATKNEDDGSDAAADTSGEQPEASGTVTPTKRGAAASQRGSPRKHAPTGRPRGRPRKDASLVNVKADASSPADSSAQDGKAEEDEAVQSSGDAPSDTPRNTRAKSQSLSPSKRMTQEERIAAGKRRARSREEAYAGWIEEVETDEEARELFATILKRIRDLLAEKGNAVAIAYLETGAADSSEEEPMSLQMVNERATTNVYSSSIDFEKDMMQLFKNGRRHFAIGTEEYGIIVTLQRMYQHITQSVEAVHGEISDEVKSRNYASLRYGPCQNPPEEERYGESPALAAKVPTKLRYKGRRIVTGNWIHLANPTDPARPIVAQVFKTRSEDLGDHNQDWVTACWFPRPEQTRHTRSMQFWDNEVVKTTMLIEHHIEDVLEFVCVMFPQKYVRGRPAEGEGGWHLGDPLYVCEYRYNVERSIFTPIKNWASGMPEDTKSKRFDMVEYDEPLVMPEKLESPFLRGVTGPGELVSEMQLQNEAVASNLAAIQASNNAGPAAAATREREASIAVPDPTEAGAVPMLFKEWADEVVASKKAFRKERKERLAREAAAQQQAQAVGAGPHSSPQDQSSPLAMAPSSHAASISPHLAPHGSARGTSGTPSRPGQRVPMVAPTADRSLMQTMNQMPDASGFFKPLSQQAQQLFLQDAETGTVVWHAAPPVTSPTLANLQRKWNGGEKFQAHSLDYLYKLATSGPASRGGGNSRTRTFSEAMPSAEDGDTSMADVEEAAADSAPKKAKVGAAPSVLDLTQEHQKDPETLLAEALRKAGSTLSQKYNFVAEHA